MPSLWQSLCHFAPALEETNHPVIAFTGAGGKTTWILALARELQAQGKKVLVTTTTHMYIPQRWAVLDNDVEAIENQLQREGLAVAGIAAGEKKISALDAGIFQKACEVADVILVEADGCRHRPCKVMGPREPVIPANCTAMCCLVGMNSLGQTIGHACFRQELTTEHPETIITPQVLGHLWQTYNLDVLRNCYPQIPLIPIVHQAGTTERREAAACMVQASGEECIISSVAVDVALIYLASGFGRRFGSNKLLAPLQGKPLYAHGLQHVLAARTILQQQGLTSAIYVVSQYDDILAAADDEFLAAVRNGQAEEGMAASVRLGVATAGNAKNYAFFAADQPCLDGQTIAAFLQGALASRLSLACVTVAGKRRGSPAMFSHIYRDELLSLHGDVGGRDILRCHEEKLYTYAVEAEVLQDIDTPAQLQDLGYPK